MSRKGSPPPLGARPSRLRKTLGSLVTTAQNTHEVSKLAILVNGLYLWLPPGFKHCSEGFPWICSFSDEPRDSPFFMWRQRVQPWQRPSPDSWGRVLATSLFQEGQAVRGTREAGPARAPSPRPRAPTFPPGRPGLRPGHTMPPSHVQTGRLDAHAPFCSAGSGGWGAAPERGLG